MNEENTVKTFPARLTSIIGNWLHKYRKLMYVAAIPIVILMGLLPLGFKSKYFTYIHAKIVWNRYCRDELIRLNPKCEGYLSKGDSMFDCLFVEWVDFFINGRDFGLKYHSFREDDKLEWAGGYVGLNFNSCNIEDLSPLKKMTMIDNLVIYNTKVRNIDFISYMPDLEYLDVTKSPLHSFPLLKKTKIIALTLDETKLSDISSLRGMTLNRCSLSGIPQLTDISVFKSMRVEYLNLDKTGIDNIDALKECRGLQGLSIDFCNVSDLSPLVNKRLEWLSMMKTKVDDLTPLVKTKSPEKLDIQLYGSPAAQRPVPAGLNKDRVDKNKPYWFKE